jgi:hypothetical protein
MVDLRLAISAFGDEVTRRFRTGAGEPEDLLRGPFEQLMYNAAEMLGVAEVIMAGEHHLTEERVRPDYAVHVRGVLVGFTEVKAPGKGVDTSRYRGHDRAQWGRLACLPNVLYTDGQSFALYRDGDLVGSIVRLVGDVETSGAALTLGDGDASLEQLFLDFLTWQPVSPRRPRELAVTAARLCRLLRAEVQELLSTEAGLEALAEDWRILLFPEATDAEFADGYSQTVTFALVLARVEGIELQGRTLHDVADELGARHTLIGQALAVLTDSAVLREQTVSVRMLQRVLAVVDWPTLSKGHKTAWLYFYEEFLAAYDPALRRATGSYYTPVGAVDPIVRLVDEALRTRLSAEAGFASPEVTVVDPAVGTGTFLIRILEHIAASVRAEEGAGAVGARVRQAARRLVGFENQAGPYAVAEVRLASEYAELGANLSAADLRLYLADTLANPAEEEGHLPAVYAPIAQSRRRANEVKRAQRILVVLGNPPYRERAKGDGGWIEAGEPLPASRGNAMSEEAVRRGRARAERAARQSAPLATFFPPQEWGVGAHLKHLYNLYVYFWRWATWKVFDGNPGDRGVVAFITVAGFLNGPGFAGMRSYLRHKADAVWIIDCSPEGHQPDVPTRLFEGVQQPVCITIAVRDGSTGHDTPATVRFRSVAGLRDQKFAQLDAISLAGDGWQECADDWGAPFLPASNAGWLALPSIDDLLAWSTSGVTPNRTWVIAPSATVLRRRVEKLFAAPATERPTLLKETPTTNMLAVPPGLAGFARPKIPLSEEQSHGIAKPIRYASRSFDRRWILPDSRLIHRPRPPLWQTRTAPGQVFLTGLVATSPAAGPSLTATNLLPDLDHYRGSFGGRAWPLWLDAAGNDPNVVPGVLDLLGRRYRRAVSPEDLFAYIAGVTAHPGYVTRFRRDLGIPGLRIPLTASSGLFDEEAGLGRRVLWLHTYGEVFADVCEGRPAGRPRPADAQRALVVAAIPDGPDGMPETIQYDALTSTLHVGGGYIAPVSPAVWEYEVSGRKIVKRWFDSRKREPDGRRSSALDDVVATSWDPDWTTELIDLLNMLTMLVELEPAQVALLARVMDGPLITVDDLALAGVGTERPSPTRQARARAGRLFEID